MKIIIISTHTKDGLQIAKALQEANDDMLIAPVFTTSLQMRGKTGEVLYYMPNEEVELGYRNNAFMWVHTNPDCTMGVTMPDMYSSNIFVMTYGDFNNISNPVLNELMNNEEEELLLVVLDDSKSKKTDDELREARSAYERIDMCKYLYFLDEPVHNASECILKYIVSDEEEREKIIDALNN